MTIAVVDIGTITARLLIVGDDGGRTKGRAYCRLGEGLDRTGELSTQSLERTAVALSSFASAIREAGADRVRVVATSAARDASNSDLLVEMVSRILGVEPEILPGSDEGRLAFAGATGAHVKQGGEALTIDIGGGSTEFVIGTVPDPEVRSFSTDMGASRFTEAYIESDPPAPEELSAALSVVELHVADAVMALPDLARIASDGQVIGIGGTITTVAAVDLALAEYDSDRVNGHVLTHAAVEDTFRALVTESREDRVHNPGLEANRVDIIVGGMCVMVEVMRQLDISEILVSEYGILDGVVASMASGLS